MGNIYKLKILGFSLISLTVITCIAIFRTPEKVSDANSSPTPSIQSAASSRVETTQTIITPQPTQTPSITQYPLHTNIIATTFWIGELFDESRADGSQVCSTYDNNWAFHYSGVNKGVVPQDAEGCAGSILGGCDGIISKGVCQTEKRLQSNNYFPSSMKPLENPFYLDLPYDDVNDPIAFKERCQVIPWAKSSKECANKNYSFMKNRWVKIIGPTKAVCYGQNQDAGPSQGDLYHDKEYVFGINDARPTQKEFNNAGLDVSPALNSCLNFAELNGSDDKVSWQFVEEVNVPNGPWKQIITTRQVNN